MHRAQSIRAVAAHAGQHHSHRASAIHRGDGAKQGIGRGSNTPDGSRLIERDDRTIGSGPHPHMIIARGDVCRVGDHGRTVIRFHDAERADRIESFRETACELGRHVLHDEDGRAAPRRQPRDQIGERARPAGGCGDADRKHRATTQCQLGRMQDRRGGARQHLHVRHVRRERTVDRGDELRAQRREDGSGMAGHVRRRRRLGHDLDSAELERADRGRRAGTGVRAHDDNRPRRFGHDVADRAQTIELRHLEVERDDVGIVLMDFADRVEPVACRRNDPKLSVVRFPATQHVDEHAAHQRAVIRDEHRRTSARARAHQITSSSAPTDRISTRPSWTWNRTLRPRSPPTASRTMGIEAIRRAVRAASTLRSPI